MTTENFDQQLDELYAEIQALRAQVINMQKMSTMGALSASITHEFNNILTTVINYAKMGLRHKDAATRDKAFDKILNAGERAARISRNMLAYARNNQTRQEPSNLVQLAQDVLVLMEKDLQVHRIRLETRWKEAAYANINTGQIQQVLLNLMINARQAMESGGTLTITVQANKEANMAEISVQDTGSGIPADKLPKIFEPFFSTKQIDEQGQGGTGLGLSLCKDIMEMHKGRIRVESAPGVGTTFMLRFPLVPAPSLISTASKAVAN